jgi:hypothetical protein
MGLDFIVTLLVLQFSDLRWKEVCQEGLLSEGILM